MTTLTGLHPFQHFDLESLPEWRHLDFNAQRADADEQAVNEIEASFQQGLRDRRLRRFLRNYLDCARGILERSGDEPLVYALLCEALGRLIFYYAFLTHRGRAALAAEGSSVTWTVAPDLLRYSRGIADEVERAGRRTSDYYPLSRDPPLAEWVRRNVRPQIESYIDGHAITPHAHIRVVTTERFEQTWEYMYRHHQYGYYHWDELPYSMPLIVYLDDVGPDHGPYSYVDGSDKMPQNLTIRAFTQAITCKVLAAPRIDEVHRRLVARLPRVLRGGETVGLHIDPDIFGRYPVRHMTGAAGTAILSDGFSLVHGGGHPRKGRRRALFVAHRYPRKPLLDQYAAVARRWWRLRVPRRSPPFVRPPGGTTQPP